MNQFFNNNPNNYNLNQGKSDANTTMKVKEDLSQENSTTLKFYEYNNSTTGNRIDTSNFKIDSNYTPIVTNPNSAKDIKIP